MSTIPPDLLYTKSHEWLKLDDGIATIGITDYAQASLGDVTYVQLPAVGTKLTSGQIFGVVESVKAASDLYAPLSGEVVEVNPALDSAPDTLNQDPHGAGWMIKLKLDNPSDTSALLSADAYLAEIA